MDSNLLNEKWNEVCKRVKTYDNLDASQIDAFFPLLKPQAMSDGFLMLTSTNDFIKNWIEKHYLESIKRALQELYHMPYTVLVEVDTSQTQNARLENGSSQVPAQSSAGAVNAGSVGFAPSDQPEGRGITNGSGNVNSGNHAPQTSRGIHNTSYQTAYDSFDTSYDHYRERSSMISPGGEFEGSNGEERYERPSSTLTFENFVIGDSNRMAYSMAVNVAEMPGETPLNPLFIYGKSGLGKTHLMRAIQNYIHETQPHLRTIYVDSAELLSDYMDAGAAHDKEKTSYKNFKTRYEEADVLLIDDIQYLQGKKQTLDIVFQIFNKLTNQGKQIVLSADRAPKNIDIDERYHSRFNQGGTIDIQPPEIETKLGIVKSFINEYKTNEGLTHFSVPEDIQMYIADISSSNIRELKSAITKVIYQMTFFQQPNLTVADVRTLLENHFSGGSSKNLTVEDIQKEVETFFKVKHSDLIGPKRARNVVYPRQIAIYLCRQLLDLPFNDIGKKFNRDHSTAMHSVATVEEMMRDSREVQEEIETLKQIIREL